MYTHCVLLTEVSFTNLNPDDDLVVAYVRVYLVEGKEVDCYFQSESVENYETESYACQYRI